MNEVRLTSVRFPKPNRLEVRLARRGPLARAFGPRFWCEYDVPIDTVPESIAIIPVLGTILPIAWALDGDVHLPVVDGALLECLDELKQAHGALYPDVRFRGRLRRARYGRERGPHERDERGGW